MKRFMVRADDLGYSKAVNYGILETVKNGVIKNIGFMVNMPNSVHGYELVKDYDICLGQHTNVCVGKPISDPSKIPSLVDENGMFKSSKEYRNSKEDFVVIEEAVIEIEAQYHKFVEITGYQPHYFEAHAVMSNNLMIALKQVADKYGLKFCGISFDSSAIDVDGQKMYMWMDSMNPTYDPFTFFTSIYENTIPDGYHMMVCHPGYLDEYLLETSSLTTPRVKEVEMLCSHQFSDYLKEHEIKLYTYDEVHP